MRPRTQEIIELSGEAFTVLLLLGGVLSPLVVAVSYGWEMLAWLWEVCRQWL